MTIANEFKEVYSAHEEDKNKTFGNPKGQLKGYTLIKQAAKRINNEEKQRQDKDLDKAQRATQGTTLTMRNNDNHEKGIGTYDLFSIYQSGNRSCKTRLSLP